MRDPFAVLAAVELRDEEGAGQWSAPSGFDMFLMARWRHKRHQEVMAILGCACPQCRVDAADMMAGRRIVTRGSG